MEIFQSIDSIRDALAHERYIIDQKLATALFLGYHLNKPLLVEGPAGVGKTELAKVVARATGAELVRLQCYPGLDESKSLYEWNYQKQLLYIQSREAGSGWQELKTNIFSEEFLLARPLLKVFQMDYPAVLLIDEIDKSDEELESFFLEALSDFQVTIPELGTIKAKHQPFVILTSNNSRDFSDALKRRCVHLFLNYPPFDRELAIVLLKVPGIRERLGEQLVTFVQTIRKLPLKKAPSISETLDWASAIVLMGASELGEEVAQDTLNLLLKYRDDVKLVEEKLPALLPQSDPPTEISLPTPGKQDATDNPDLSRFNF